MISIWANKEGELFDVSVWLWLNIEHKCPEKHPPGLSVTKLHNIKIEINFVPQILNIRQSWLILLWLIFMIYGTKFTLVLSLMIFLCKMNVMWHIAGVCDPCWLERIVRRTQCLQTSSLCLSSGSSLIFRNCRSEWSLQWYIFESYFKLIIIICTALVITKLLRFCKL